MTKVHRLHAPRIGSSTKLSMEAKPSKHHSIEAMTSQGRASRPKFERKSKGFFPLTILVMQWLQSPIRRVFYHK
jgi:hypothetical protein